MKVVKNLTFSMNQFLSNIPYQDLNKANTERRDLESMSAQAKIYHEVIKDNLDNPLIWPGCDELNNISFCLHVGLSNEEKEMPTFLLPKGGPMMILLKTIISTSNA